MKINQLALAVLSFLLILSTSLADNYITQSNAHHAISDDTTFGILHQYELNYAAVLGDENHVVQDNDQYAKGVDITQCAANRILLIGHENYATQTNHADAPNDGESGVKDIRQSQSNILAIIGEYNGDQSEPIVQSNDAFAINEAIGASIDQFQSNEAMVLENNNYLEQKNSANAQMAAVPNEIKQIQKNLAFLIGTSGQFVPPTLEESPLVKINALNCFIPDPQCGQSES